MFKITVRFYIVSPVGRTDTGSFSDNSDKANIWPGPDKPVKQDRVKQKLYKTNCKNRYTRIYRQIQT